MLSKTQLVSIFRRNGSSGTQTLEFDQLPDYEKAEAASMYDAVGGEQAALFHRGKEWIVITDKRVIFGGNGQSKYFFNEEVKSASFDRLEAMRSRARTASDLDTLVVTLHDGAQHQLRFEPGQPFSGAWNVLKAIASSN